jgi:hypothetical protein
MLDEPGERKSDLATRLDALEIAAARPSTANGRNEIVPRMLGVLVTLAIIVFLGWQGWGYFDSWRQLSGLTRGLEANAAALVAAADAKGLHLDDEPLLVQKTRVEVANLQAEADKARAEADAQSRVVGDASMRLNLLRAEIARTQAEADKAQAEADAQTQIINGIPLAVAQKQAEVRKAEAEAQQKIETVKPVFAIAKLLKSWGGENYKEYEKIFMMLNGGGASSPCSLYNLSGCDNKK